MAKLYFYKENEKAILPSKREEDAGFDVYMVPSDTDIIIEKGQTLLLDTGLKSAFDKDYVLLGRERGSTGIKGMRFGAGVIDSGYRGNIMIPINNTSDKPICLTHDNRTSDDNMICYPQNKAIGQLLLVPVIHADVTELTKEQYDSLESQRGQGAFGSSNK